ncbi:MAG: leucine-rich repeat domain-containing protein [Clostridia bacterium]
MKKKIISVSIVLVILASFVSSFSAFALTVDKGTYKYEILDNDSMSIKIVNYNGEKRKLEIPKTIGGKTVTEIAEYSFDHLVNLEEVIIPSTVDSIDANAFYNCPALKSVTIPGRVFTLNKIFNRCKSLETVNILNGVVNIVDNALKGCGNLQTIDIPKSVWYIGSDVFPTTLEEINVSEENKEYCSENGVLYDKTKEILISYPCAKEGDFTVPSGVLEIGTTAFKEAKELEKITLPNSLLVVGDNAFEKSEKLADIALPDSVISVGRFAFDETLWFENQPNGFVYIGKTAYCNKGNKEEIKEISIKDGTKTIADGAFSGLTELKRVTIPTSLTDIGHAIFDGCINLKEISVSIDNRYFVSEKNVLYNSEKTRLIASASNEESGFEIPRSVLRIEDFAFSNYIKLEKVTISEEIQSVGYNAFINTALQKNATNGVLYINNIAYTYIGEMPKEEAVVIKKGIVTLADGFLENNDRVVKVSLPTTLQHIGNSAFYNCINLSAINIPNGVESIDDNAFAYCYSLNELTIPGSVTYIGEGVFYDCLNLNVTCPDNIYAREYVKQNLYSSPFFDDAELDDIKLTSELLKEAAPTAKLGLVVSSSLLVVTLVVLLVLYILCRKKKNSDIQK